MSKAIYTIAFDLGGVVFSADNDIFSNKYLETELTPGIFQLILHLSRHAQVKLIIISKAFPKNAKKSREILQAYGLDELFNSIIFCENNHSKFAIAKAMNVNIMIDDKKDVLDCFDSTIKTFLFTNNRVNELYKLIHTLIDFK